MSQTYRLQGLDCPNCAAKIEREIRRIADDPSVNVNFMEKTVAFPAHLLPEVQKTVKRLEPGVEVQPISSGAESADDEEESSRRTLIRITLAAVLFVPSLFFQEALHTSGPFVEYTVYLTAFLLVGWPVLRAALVNIVRLNPFNEQFLMTVATTGAIAIHQLPEAVGVMLFYAVGEYFQDRAVHRSRRSIKALLDVRPETARLVEDGSACEIHPREVALGAIIEVRPGERIPLDGEVVQGSAQLDTSALTGESVPRNVETGDEALAGSINLNSVLRIRVSRRFEDCSVSKIVKLVQEAAGNKAPTEQFITTFARWYTPVVVGGAALIAFVPPLVTGQAFSFWIYRALVLLVISCPCALVVSIPMSYFAGLGAASRKGILIKGGQFLDALNSVASVVLDKTGTLTEGVFEVTKVTPANGASEEELLHYAAIAESRSNHPIATAIHRAYGKNGVPELTDYEEIRGHGIKARMPSGEVLIAGNDRLLHRENIEHTDCVSDATVVYTAVDGKLIGTINVGDKLKEDSPSAIRRLRKLGVKKIVMLTGDNPAAAQQIASACEIDEFYSELLPEQKVEKVLELEKQRDGLRGSLAFIGDGINDAPVLARSDVGIAMGALGSDAAIEAADVVLMNDQITQLPHAIEISRRIRGIVTQNIVMILAIKGLFIILGAAGMAGMWEAVFADVGITVIAVLNSLRGLR